MTVPLDKNEGKSAVTSIHQYCPSCFSCDTRMTELAFRSCVQTHDQVAQTFGLLQGARGSCYFCTTHTIFLHETANRGEVWRLMHMQVSGIFEMHISSCLVANFSDLTLPKTVVTKIMKRLQLLQVVAKRLSCDHFRSYQRSNTEVVYIALVFVRSSTQRSAGTVSGINCAAATAVNATVASGIKVPRATSRRYC